MMMMMMMSSSRRSISFLCGKKSPAFEKGVGVFLGRHAKMLRVFDEKTTMTV